MPYGRLAATPGVPEIGPVARRRLITAILAIAAIAVFLGTWALVRQLTSQAYYGTADITDIPVYRDFAAAIAGGAFPYRDIGTAYPPAAFPAFLVPWVMAGGDEAAYSGAFLAFMAGVGALLVLLVTVAVRHLPVPGLHPRAAILLVAISPLLVGPVVTSRFDLLPALVAAVAIVLAATGRLRIAAIVLGVAIATKVWPAVILPLLIAAAWRRSGRRAAVTVLVLTVLTTVLILVPFLLVTPSGVLATLTEQLSRPLQVESLGASVLFVLHFLVGLPVTIVSSFGSQNIDGDLAGALAALSSLALGVGLVTVWLRFARSPADAPRLLTAAAAAVAVYIAFGKVLSPQYVIWLLPIVTLVPGRRGLVAIGLYAIALLGTVGYFPAGYQALVAQEDARIAWSLLIRNIALVALAIELLLPWERIAAGVVALRSDPAVRARWIARIPSPSTLFVLLFIASLLIRALWLAKPDGSLIFDETYYVNAARVIDGLALPDKAPYATAPPFIDPNMEHPPLGKALIALSMSLFGDQAIGWRLPSIVTGMLSIVAIWSIVQVLTRRPWIALLAATLLSLDVLSFIHGRIGTLDMMAVGFALVGARFALVRKRPVAGALLAGTFLALACLVKIPSIYAVLAVVAWAAVPIVGEWRARARLPWRAVLRTYVPLLGALAVVGIVGLWLLDLRYTEFTSPFDHVRHMLTYGFNLADKYTPNSITSDPWQWLVNDVQIDYLKVAVNTSVNGETIGSRAAVEFRALINPVLLAGMAIVVPWGIHQAWRRRDRLAGWSLVWMGANWLPYVALALLTNRVMYFYYVLPVVPGLAALSALFLVRSRLPRIVLVAYLLLAVGAFLAWFPFRQLPS